MASSCKVLNVDSCSESLRRTRFDAERAKEKTSMRDVLKEYLSKGWNPTANIFPQAPKRINQQYWGSQQSRPGQGTFNQPFFDQGGQSNWLKKYAGLNTSTGENVQSVLSRVQSIVQNAEEMIHCIEINNTSPECRKRQEEEQRRQQFPFGPPPPQQQLPASPESPGVQQQPLGGSESSASDQQQPAPNPSPEAQQPLTEPPETIQATVPASDQGTTST